MAEGRVKVRVMVKVVVMTKRRKYKLKSWLSWSFFGPSAFWEAFCLRYCFLPACVLLFFTLRAAHTARTAK